MSRSISQLTAEKAKLEKQIEQEQHKLSRLENRARYLEKGERQKRAHRLITRGAAVESIVPEVKGMGEAEFYNLMEKVLAVPEVQSLFPKGDD